MEMQSTQNSQNNIEEAKCRKTDTTELQDLL